MILFHILFPSCETFNKPVIFTLPITHFKWDIHQIDVNNAFLNYLLQEDYMKYSNQK
jgi:hypothetical protein